MLAIGLSVAVLIPATALAVLLWQGTIELPPIQSPQSQSSQSLPPKTQQASLTAGPETVLPKQSLVWSKVALVVPASVEIEPAKPLPFDVAIDSPDRLPPRAVLTVHGLPQGATFSKGRPFREAAVFGVADPRWGETPIAAVVLLAGAGLLVRSYGRITEVDPGFSADHVLTFRLALPETKFSTQESATQFIATCVERLARAAGAESAAAIMGLPLDTDFSVSSSFPFSDRWAISSPPRAGGTSTR